jgi:methionine sulfoxide reductase catalytic subunit
MPDPVLAGTTRSPQALAAYRDRLTKGEDAIDPDRWSGSLPAASGVPPRIRIGSSRWFNLLWLLPIGFVLLIVAVAAAQGLRHVPAVDRFIARYPGTTVPASARAHPGLPVWVDVTHFLNLLLMVFIIRSGIQILADHPRLYWTRHSTPGKDWFRFQRPVPEDPNWTAKQDSVTLPKHLGLPGLRHSIGLARWWHLGTDMLWLANGIVFYILLFATGQWQRVVPTSWSVFPNAASVIIQYLSLQWPKESAWIAYNGLQQLAYFVTVFVAAPLALVTGLGMSPALSTRFKRISKPLSIQVARSLHFVVLCWFLVFILIHTTLVFTTGPPEPEHGLRGPGLRQLGRVRRLRRLHGGRGGGVGRRDAAHHSASTVGATGRLRPHWAAAATVRARRRQARRVLGEGRLLVLLAQRCVSPDRGVPEAVRHRLRRLPPPGPRPGRESRGAEPRGGTGAPLSRAGHPALLHPGVVGGGEVGRGVDVDHPRPRAPEPRSPLGRLLLARRRAGGGLYYDAHPIEQMRNPLTMLAYDMNEPLSYGHGAPLRLRNEVQLGFKQVKWIAGIEFVAHFTEVGGGYGGYNEDHEFFGYRQSI